MDGMELLHDITPAQLSCAFEELKLSHPSDEELSQSVTHLLSSCLSRYPSRKTQNVIKQFGFDAKGNNISGHLITVEQLDQMIQQLGLGEEMHHKTLQNPKYLVTVSANCGMDLCAYLTHGGLLREQQLAKKPILRLPHNLEFMGPNQPSLVKFYLFSSSEHSIDFYSKVQAYGWRIASDMFKSQCIGNYKSDLSKAMEINKECIYVVKCVYLPKKSFQISKHQMRLSDDAIREALQVKTLSDAAKFLKKYQSHASQSLYHVGGCCLTSMAIEKCQNIESKLTFSLLELLAGIGGDFCASLELQAQLTSQRSSFFETGQIKKVFLALGPTALDEASFCEKLDKDPSSWAIIDKDECEISDLVGVWEIMLQEENKGLEKAAKLVCNSWQSQIVNLHRELSHLLGDSKKFLETDELTGPHSCDIVMPADLPSALTKLRLSQQEDNELELTGSVTQLLNSCLTVHPSKIVESVIDSFGFDTKGNKTDGHPIVGDLLDVMIQQLRKGMQDGPEENIENITVETCWPQRSNHINSEVAKEYISRNAMYHYMGDIVVDRPLKDKEEPCRRLLDRLRHRVEPFQSCLDDLQAKEVDNASLTKFDSPLEVLAYTVENADLVTQIAICEFLLEQRSSYPLILETGNPDTPFKCYAQALEFVEVKVQKEQLISMAEDQRLPRVVFVSDCSSNIAHSVTNCDFVSGYGCDDTVTGIVEIGMGFIGQFNCLAFNIRFSTSLPEILTHFAQQIADVVVMDVTKEINAFDDLIVYRCKFDRKFSKKEGMINGPGDAVSRELKSCLSKDMQQKTYKRKTLKDICISLFRRQSWLMYPEIQNTCNEIHFSKIYEELKLQKSYRLEASLEFQLLSFRNNKGKAHITTIQIQEERRRRRNLARTVAALPIIQLFHSLLSQDDALCRVSSIMCLQKQICNEILKCDEATQHLDAKQDLNVDKHLDINHLWRELCHIFIADPKGQRHICQLAAQHLVDGFPLEIVDGDAGRFCQVWVESILVELEQMLIGELGRTPKISVLSVIGQQSSGKSTLLNRI